MLLNIFMLNDKINSMLYNLVLYKTKKHLY